MQRFQNPPTYLRRGEPVAPRTADHVGEDAGQTASTLGGHRINGKQVRTLLVISPAAWVLARRKALTAATSQSRLLSASGLGQKDMLAAEDAIRRAVHEARGRAQHISSRAARIEIAAELPEEGWWAVENYLLWRPSTFGSAGVKHAPSGVGLGTNSFSESLFPVLDRSASALAFAISKPFTRDEQEPVRRAALEDDAWWASAKARRWRRDNRDHQAVRQALRAQWERTLESA